jgi:hypothetical protein
MDMQIDQAMKKGNYGKGIFITPDPKPETFDPKTYILKTLKNMKPKPTP